MTNQILIRLTWTLKGIWGRCLLGCGGECVVAGNVDRQLPDESGGLQLTGSAAAQLTRSPGRLRVQVGFQLFFES